jgi:hypothetical protein
MNNHISYNKKGKANHQFNADLIEGEGGDEDEKIAQERQCSK